MENEFNDSRKVEGDRLSKYVIDTRNLFFRGFDLNRKKEKKRKERTEEFNELFFFFLLWKFYDFGGNDLAPFRN